MSAIKNIEEYCKTLNPKYLNLLEYKYVIFFQRVSIYALKYNGNKKIAKAILDHYNMDDNGILKSTPTKPLPPSSEKDVRIMLDRFSIALTGAREGDIVMGTMPASNNAIIKLMGDIYPIKSRLDALRAYENTPHDIWNEFLNRLGSIEFFSSMSIWDRKEWLSENEISGNKKTIEKITVPVQFLQPGDGKSNVFMELPLYEITKLMDLNPNSEDGYWTMDEFNELVTEYRNKPTLLVLVAFWKIVTRFKIVEEYDGLTLDLLNGEIMDGSRANSNEKIVILEKLVESYSKIGKEKGGKHVHKIVSPWRPKTYQTIGMIIPKNQDLPTVAYDIIKKKGVNIELFKNSTLNFTAASYKSLLQKIIRFMPIEVIMANGVNMPGDHVLLATLAFLLNHPGAFVPNIQRFVTGLESATKRLGVTIIEDSSVPEDMYDQLGSLFACSLVKQRMKEWNPTKNLIERWFMIAVFAYNNPIKNVVDYVGEISKKPYTLELDNNVLKNISCILDELKSFAGDLGLARGWARDYPNIKTETVKQRPKTMPIFHCIDQHWAPNFVYFYDPQLIISENSKENTSKPFEPLLNRVFRECTGINPRFLEKSKKFGVVDFNNFEDIPFVRHTRVAQKLFLLALQEEQTEREETGEYVDFNYEIPNGWLAGMVGGVEIKLKTDPDFLDPIQLKARENGEKIPERPTKIVAIVTLKVDDPTEMVVAKKPSRGEKYKFIFSPEEEERVFTTMKDKLRRGFYMTQATAPDPSLKNCKLFLNDKGDEPFYEIQKNGKGTKITWEQARLLTIKLPILQELELRDIEDALLNTGYGVEEDYIKKIENILDNIDKRILRRILTYLVSTDSTIEMNRVSRDGGSTKLPVNLWDVPAYQTLLQISIIAPIALRPKPGYPAIFTVPNGPVLWTIKEMIAERTRDRISQEDIAGWNKSRFVHDTFNLTEPQEDVLSNMILNHRKKYRGNFIWSTVGSGKCLSPCTKVLLWNGTIKQAKDIVEGDLLIGDNNEPRKVLSTCKGIDNMYKIKQLQGEDYIVNEPHILTLKYFGHKGITWLEKNNYYRLEWFDKNTMSSYRKQFSANLVSVPGYENKEEAYKALMKFRDTIPDDNIVDIAVKDYLKLSKYDQKQFKGFKVSVEFPEQTVFIDPYVLGMWLGYGFNDIDSNCINYFEKYINFIGCNWNKKPKYITGVSPDKNYFLQSLEFYNIRNNKHIPLSYLKNSRRVRLEVLAGIIDTDGYLTNGYYEITQKRKVLADNICYLARSLGFYVNCTEVQKSGTYYRCTFRGDNIPCKILRRVAHPRKQKNDVLSTSITIEPLGLGDYCGFTLDGNGRFLLNDFTVTHNTFMVLAYLKYLKDNNQLPKYIIYTLPNSAINNTIQIINSFGIQVQLMDATKTTKSKISKYKKMVKYSRNCVPLPYYINLIEHDHLKMCPKLTSYGSNSVFLIDEVHKLLNDSLRTGAGLDLALISQEFVAFTGTPVIDNDITKLITWLKQIVPFEVNKRNFWVAVNNMVARNIDTGLETIFENIKANFSNSELSAYQKLVPPGKLGGTNVNTNAQDWKKAFEICWNVCDKEMVKLSVQLIDEGRGVMVVSQNIKHQNKLYQMYIDEGVDAEDIFLINKDNSLTLTDASVESGETPDYKIVIVTKNEAEGYTLTRLNAKVSSVYFSNNATRTQLNGRINRIGQVVEPLLYYTVHTGLLTTLLEKHDSARSLSQAMQALAEE